MYVTRTGTPPLLDAPAHKWSTMAKILKQTQGIYAKVMSPSRKTVVILDLKVYNPKKKFQIARQDMGNLILPPGE
jgi:hypothetical protein